jgi:hypothetical protein
VTVHEYFADIAEELSRRSDRIRLGFSTHRPSAGENREGIVASFLRDYLPQAFGIDTGLILSTSGEFSNEADVVVVDQIYNAPLYPSEPNKLWLIESVYALIEVKTTLTPDELQDAIQKCRRFKTLPRKFDSLPEPPRIADSLFVLWAFNGPKPETIKANLLKALHDVPVAEQPDFMVIPDSVVITTGRYRQLVLASRPNSSLPAYTITDSEGNKTVVPESSMRVLDLGTNALLAWLIWFTSWLKAAGHRSAPLTAYLLQGHILGEEV